MIEHVLSMECWCQPRVEAYGSEEMRMPRDATGKFVSEETPVPIDPTPTPAPGDETGSPRLIPYNIQYALAIGVAFAALVVGGVSLQAPVFGLSPAVLAGIAILQTCLTFAAGLLPKLYRPPSDARAGQD